MINIYDVIDDKPNAFEAKTFTGLILSPKGYRMWSSILKYDLYELSANVILLLNFVISPNKQCKLFGDELFFSKMFTEQIIPLLENESTYSKACSDKINKTQCDLVIASLCLLSNLIAIRGIKRDKTICDFQTEENIFYKIIDIFIKYISIQNDKYLIYIFYGLSQIEHLQSNQSNAYYEYIAKAKIMFNIIIKLNFNNSNNKDHNEIILYAHRTLGNLFGAITVSNYYSNEEIKLLLEHFAMYFTSNTKEIKKESAWVVSNMVTENMTISNIAVNSNIFIQGLLNYFDVLTNKKIIEEGLIVIQILLTNIDLNNFFRFIEAGFFDIIMKIAYFDNLDDDILTTAFICIELCLKRGAALIEQVHYNKMLDMFLLKGGRELILKYQHTDYIQLKEIINEIEENYLENNNTNMSDSIEGMVMLNNKNNILI